MGDVRHILRRHGIRHCVVGGHSYGSIWAGWIIRALREEVKQAVLLDPVRAHASPFSPPVLSPPRLSPTRHLTSSTDAHP